MNPFRLQRFNLPSVALACVCLAGPVVGSARAADEAVTASPAVKTLRISSRYMPPTGLWKACRCSSVI